ncbi:glycosyltransferase family 1 protein [Brooklawnia cerclae]|uniref:Starch phosphorylase n=1 Tax=Brooklawnia cerclae TaxID=349934 RepID=A0ABX0SGY6_9ACTN|nr:starch phosphorylase [Brooklawnia cerclae]
MRAIRRFIVQPVLPEPLRPLAELARNLRWSWHEPTREVFRAVDPDLWAAVGSDPLKLLSQVSPERLDTLAGDRRFVRNLEIVREDLHDYLTGDRWYQAFAAGHAEAPAAIGYFSAEFGISKVLPQYSGGLGILAGDHLKAASDVGAPIVGVGLLYHHGYFIQSLNASGWQQERYPLLDPNELPVSLLHDDAGAVVIEVEIRGVLTKAQVWVAQVGRVPLLLLDTNLEDNPERERLITDKLYGGGSSHRLAQEVLLGVGGVRAIRAYCRITGHAAPEVFHANEGHAVFLGLERIREFMTTGDDFDAAVEKSRAGMLFTTHTPVPAGIDRFSKDQVREQFQSFAPLPIDRIIELGAETYPGGDPNVYNMAVVGLRLGQRANGVSKLHGEVSRQMFQGLWPGFDSSEVPITSVTNGVHARTWVHPELREVLESPLETDENVVDGWDWKALDRIDDTTVWTLKRQMRGQMIIMARERLAKSAAARGMNADWVATALNPHTLTIGFARRGASYKRLTLMLSQPDRLKALLNHPTTPIQIVIAGKAHPADDIGKGLIQQMVQFSDSEDVRGKLVFLPDYDMSLARPLYPGCDVWLNNPLRPMEACGTSGMKAAINGAFNLSIRDGWWDEWYDSAFGWAIPSAETIGNQAERDAAEAESLYEIIEREIIPMFYTRDANGVPAEWVKMMRATIAGLGPKVMATRMVRDYVEQLYAPAAAAAVKVLADDTAAQLAQWKTKVRAAWPGVVVTRIESHLPDIVEVGSTNEFDAWVRLNGLDACDVAVELVSGEVDASDELRNVRITRFERPGETGEDGAVLFRVRATSQTPGLVGYTVRVVPSHPLLASRSEMGLAAVAAL